MTADSLTRVVTIAQVIWRELVREHDNTADHIANGRSFARPFFVEVLKTLDSIEISSIQVGGRPGEIETAFADLMPSLRRWCFLPNS